MISAPRSSRSRWVTALTAPRVPTGMNAGVCTTPCGVVSSPRRAAPSRSGYGIRNGVGHQDSRISSSTAPVPSAFCFCPLSLLPFCLLPLYFSRLLTPVFFCCETSSRRRAVRRAVRRARSVAGVGRGGVRQSRPHALRAGADPDREGRAVGAGRPRADRDVRGRSHRAGAARSGAARRGRPRGPLMVARPSERNDPLDRSPARRDATKRGRRSSPA